MSFHYDENAEELVHGTRDTEVRIRLREHEREELRRIVQQWEEDAEVDPEHP